MLRNSPEIRPSKTIYRRFDEGDRYHDTLKSKRKLRSGDTIDSRRVWSGMRDPLLWGSFVISTIRGSLPQPVLENAA
jgi:hypothetical protein